MEQFHKATPGIPSPNVGTLPAELAGAAPLRRVLAVCAHPDDESFGLGGILGFLSDAGVEVDLLCFTRGEASTLGCVDEGLAEVRTAELARAATALGIRKVTALDYPDGALPLVEIRELFHHVIDAAAGSDMLLVFDEGGITGHPDHCRATESALLAAAELDLPVLGWALADTIASELNHRFGTAFVGRADTEIDLSIEVDRIRQLTAIACHRSQDNPVMRARLARQGKHERLRLLRGSASRWPRR